MTPDIRKQLCDQVDLIESIHKACLPIDPNNTSRTPPKSWTRLRELHQEIKINLLSLCTLIANLMEDETVVKNAAIVEAVKREQKHTHYLTATSLIETASVTNDALTKRLVYMYSRYKDMKYLVLDEEGHKLYTELFDEYLVISEKIAEVFPNIYQSIEKLLDGPVAFGITDIEETNTTTENK